MDDKLKQAMNNLVKAMDFLHTCQKDIATSYASGAMKDAYEWLEAASIEAAEAWKRSMYYVKG